MSERIRTPDNRLLAALPPADRAIVERLLRPIELPVGLTLHEAGEPIERAWFPVTGIVSMVSDMKQGTVEIGTVGNEGMAGIHLVLHARTTTTRTFMQVPGHGWECSAGDLREAMHESPALSLLLHQYASVLFEQVAQSVACNRLHSLEERCGADPVQPRQGERRGPRGARERRVRVLRHRARAFRQAGDADGARRQVAGGRQGTVLYTCSAISHFVAWR